MSAALLIAALLKSSVVTALGLGLGRWIAVRPVDRADVLRATVCLLLLLPLLMAFGPALSLALLPTVSGVAAAPSPLWTGVIRPVEGLTVSGAVLTPSLGEVLAWSWSLGAVVVAGRFALGVWTLSRWTEEGRAVDAEAWTGALARLKPAERPLLRTSDRITAPLSWGMPPGAVLVDPATLSRSETASAVLAHELAHLRRRDWLFLALSRLALALFWFNPLVWLLHRTLIERSEEAADAIAVAQVDRHAYARALIGLAAGPGPLAATAMAGDGASLKKRIASIMTDKTPSRRPALIFAAVGVLIAVATPIAALEIRARMPEADATSAAQIADVEDAWTSAFLDTAQLPVPPAPPAPPPPPPEPAGAWPAPPPAPPAVMAPPAPPAPPPPPTPPRTARHTRWSGGSDGWSWSGSAENRARADEARQQAEVAREQAAEARVLAREYRIGARAQATEARADAEDARIRARAVMHHAAQSMAQARVSMRNGAEQMRRGAENTRREGRRLADPAYRAEQIAENAERGNIVTDEELRVLGPRLIEQADDLERQAEDLAAQSRDN